MADEVDFDDNEPVVQKPVVKEKKETKPNVSNFEAQVEQLKKTNDELREQIAELKEKKAPEVPKKTVDELLILLYKTSIDERQTILLKKYEEEMKTFRKQIGNDLFNKALGEFMTEKIEGKIVAAKMQPKKKNV